MYSLDAYLRMIADRPRIEAYEEALRRSVRPGALVADIGAGPGIMAMLACRHGARHVWAIEPAGVAGLAREVIRANGLADRITVIETSSTEAELPERVDVVVSDLRGILPFLDLHIPSIIDARERLLAPGGILIPRLDRILGALVRAEDLHPSTVVRQAEEISGLDLSAAMPVLTSIWSKAARSSLALASQPTCLGEIDYRRVTGPGFSASVDLVPSGEGPVHGFILWFDAELADGAGFTNHPAAPPLIYGQAFFPWTEPVVFPPGARARISVDAHLVENSYLWRWRTSILEGDACQASFDQSTLGGSPLHASRLARHAAGHVPVPWPQHELDLEIVRRIDGRRSNHDIALELADRCGSYEDALRRVTELVDRLGSRFES